MRLRNGNDTHKLKMICDERSQHNASSSLLKLPLEIKTMIYEYVCGYETVHIYPDTMPFIDYTFDGHANLDKPVKLTNCPCSVKMPKNPTQSFIGTIETPHRKCLDSRVRILESYGKRKIDLSFLRVCRQLYNECKLVPYETLTFFFNKDELLELFLADMPHLDAIRRLHLDIDFLSQVDWEMVGGVQDLVACGPTVIDSTAEKMTTLQYLRLDIDLDCCHYRQWPSKVGVGHGYRIMNRVLALAKLPLKDVTITLRGSGFRYGRDDEKFEWTVAKRQEWTDMVRGRLLNRGR